MDHILACYSIFYIIFWWIYIVGYLNEWSNTVRNICVSLYIRNTLTTTEYLNCVDAIESAPNNKTAMTIYRVHQSRIYIVYINSHKLPNLAPSATHLRVFFLLNCAPRKSNSICKMQRYTLRFRLCIMRIQMWRKNIISFCLYVSYILNQLWVLHYNVCVVFGVCPCGPPVRVRIWCSKSQ